MGGGVMRMTMDYQKPGAIPKVNKAQIVKLGADCLFSGLHEFKWAVLVPLFCLSWAAHPFSAFFFLADILCLTASLRFTSILYFETHHV